MSQSKRDPLLTAGMILTMFLAGITALVATLFVIMIPVLVFNQSEVAAQVAEHGTASLATVMALSITLLAAAAAAVIMANYFFRLLGRLIDTVGEGNPFTSLNADRLSKMGWIVLVFHAASLPIGALAAKLHSTFPEVDLTVDIEFSLTGVLLALVLFILARVFRHGAEMREDLKGTV